MWSGKSNWAILSSGRFTKYLTTISRVCERPLSILTSAVCLCVGRFLCQFASISPKIYVRSIPNFFAFAAPSIALCFWPVRPCVGAYVRPGLKRFHLVCCGWLLVKCRGVAWNHVDSISLRPNRSLDPLLSFSSVKQTRHSASSLSVIFQSASFQNPKLCYDFVIFQSVELHIPSQFWRLC